MQYTDEAYVTLKYEMEKQQTCMSHRTHLSHVSFKIYS